MARTIITGVVALILGIGIGAATTAPEEVVVEVPGPTQTIEVVREVPGPTQTIEVEVERAPQACLDAINELLDMGTAAYEYVSGSLSDYVDYPDENLTDFGRRIEERMASMDIESWGTVPEDDIAACRDAS
jgi:hypothetical protein